MTFWAHGMEAVGWLVVVEVDGEDEEVGVWARKLRSDVRAV